MNKPHLILIGSGGHARACIDVIEHNDQYRIAGLVGMPEEIHSRVLGYSVIGSDYDLPQLAKEYLYALVTVGQLRTPNMRIRLYEKAKELGFKLPTVISPRAHVSMHALVGAGTVVLHGATVNAGAKLGNNCIINTHAVIEHDAFVDDHCHISTGAVLNGAVKVGEGSFIGSGSVIKEGISIGKGCLVGMGLSVLKSLTDSSQFNSKV